MKTYYVYIVGNRRPTLYIGVTNNLLRRLDERRRGAIQGFTKKYGLTRLLYYEECSDVRSAIEREKRLKKWRRSWKMNLIRQMNPRLDDLWEKLTGRSTIS